MSKTVERVSLAELNSARSTMPKKEEPVKVKTQTHKNTGNESYIDRVKDSQIENLFNKYGYEGHRRDKESITVGCKDFVVMFNGYTTMVAIPEQKRADSQSEFNFNEFLQMCEIKNVLPSQVFDAKLRAAIFEEMPYYVENRKMFDENNLNQKSGNKVMDDLFKDIIKEETYKANRASVEKMYGTTDIERAADTLARLNRN